MSPIDLPAPATTNINSIVWQLKRKSSKPQRKIVFSTYQSIDVVIQALAKTKLTAELCICDEAHRTTGVKLTSRDESNFTKVHDNNLIPATRRIYMTATPRIYSPNVVVRVNRKADEKAELCSMDNTKLYGDEIYRLSFSQAVERKLLTDYKVIIFTIKEDSIPAEMRERMLLEIQSKLEEAKEKNDDRIKYEAATLDDITKMIGSIKALSKIIRQDNGITRQQDPSNMHRAVAFCRSIRPTSKSQNDSSTQLAKHFEAICSYYTDTIAKTNPDEAAQILNITAMHVDGAMSAAVRNERIAWLKAERDDNQIADNECRILCNVRCLSEGVDVPALDAIIFMAPRRSQVEIVQSVGRVMRSFGRGTDHEKKYGYIILPLLISNDMSAEAALNNEKRYKDVWSILQALRAHDEKFEAVIANIDLINKQPTPNPNPKPKPKDEIISDHQPSPPPEIIITGDDSFSDKELAILRKDLYARVVDHCGDRLYWENWARKIGDIAQKFINRIQFLIAKNDEVKTQFNIFINSLRKNINPTIDEAQVIEMLAQHMITHPIFDALFSEYNFIRNNVISRAMESMIQLLNKFGFQNDLDALKDFEEQIRISIGQNNDSSHSVLQLHSKQSIIKDLYEKFFKGAFPLTVEKLSIVYTPIECVDFIIHSVNDILRSEFNTSLTEENVHVLGPFTGTGTFITRLLQLPGVIKDEDLQRKYLNEIHANEIVLLAYYIADVNIESVFHDRLRDKLNCEYLPYDGICLTDTFQLAEPIHHEFFTPYFQENADRLDMLKRIPVRVILGNPPYSIGQRSANDNAQNLSYPTLDARIADTYAAQSKANLKKSLYDSYIKAFRWASDRIPKDEGGIVAFISNAGWLDGSGQDGMRRCFASEFSSIYVLNLRGNQRTSGELSRREGGKIFGGGSRTPIAITFLVKNPAATNSSAHIHYFDIGDYLSREQKLESVKKLHSINGVEWQTITPNEKADWINQRDGLFDTLIPINTEKKYDPKSNSFFLTYSLGLNTNRDSWMYNFSLTEVKNNISKTIEVYNQQVDIVANNIEKKPLEQIITNDSTKISWSSSLWSHLERKNKAIFQPNKIWSAIYRPFQKQALYFGEKLVHRRGQFDSFFPTPNHQNLIICVSGVGVTKDFSCIITDQLPDLELIGKSQCFPLYFYEDRVKAAKQFSLFEDSEDKYLRHDAISDWILAQARSRYGASNITKEQIFYYVYGILHSPDYRCRFADDLKKSLPRLPLVEKFEDFIAFSNAGRSLAKLHLTYEDVPPCPSVEILGDHALTGSAEDYSYFAISDKMRFRSKNDKSEIIYNPNITIKGIPARAYDYIVNGKSAIDWIVERYCISEDSKSHIVNNCNLWAQEHHKPRYILHLLLSIINLSLLSLDIIDSLPHISSFENLVASDE